MMAFALQLYVGFVLLQGAFMKSIQNTTDHDISIASLKSAVDRLREINNSNRADVCSVAASMFVSELRNNMDN
jgi:hypothetical protein